jgi:nucleoside-diphosphate-sugar epimerase
LRRIEDLDDFEGLLRALESSDLVIHSAARAHVIREHSRDPLAEFRRANVEGTKRVYEAAREVGARRFVFLSSVKAMGEGGPVPYREEDAPQPSDPYGVSKLEAELALAEARPRGGVEYVVLRPPLVYGPGVGGNLFRLLRLADLASRLPLPLGGIANKRSLISVNNLVSAIELAMLHSAAADQTFLVSDGEDLSTSDLIRRLTKGLGREAHLLPCPSRLARALGTAVGRGYEINRLLGSLQVDSGRIRRTLGWRPPEEVTDGLARMATWYSAGAPRG